MSMHSAHHTPPQVRPTLKALKALPAEGSGVADALRVLERAKRAADPDTRRRILTELRLDEMRQPLLDDARNALAGVGVLDLHASSTKVAGRSVYEVRDRTGAAWRGAVMRAGGVLWLVFAERHDRFHSTAASFFQKGDWEPTELDKALAQQDAVRHQQHQWRVDALARFLDVLRVAVTEQRPVEFELAALTGSDVCTLRLEIEHEVPAASVELAHTTSGMLDVSLLIRGSSYDLVKAILEVVAVVRDGDQDQAFLPGGDLQLLSTVSHARLAQLTAVVNATTDFPERATDLPAPTALHYVNADRLAEGYVDGTAVLSLCGEWFVPSVDGSADLPVCRGCEERKPVAQAILDGLRS